MAHSKAGVEIHPRAGELDLVAPALAEAMADACPDAHFSAGEPRAALCYGSIFQHVAVGILRTSISGLILEANPYVCRMFGYPSAELCGRVTRELTYPEDRDKHDHLRLQLLAGEIGHFSAEKRFLRNDGSVIWINRTVTVARDAANEEPYLIQVMEDISVRKGSEAQFERMRRAREVMAACNRVLAHATDEAQMLAQMCRIAVEAGGYRQSWIGLVTGDEKCPVQVAAFAGYSPGTRPMSSPAVWSDDGRYLGKMAEVVARGELAIERDILGDPRYAQLRPRARAFGLGSSLTLPLACGGRIFGGFEFNAREVDAFDADEIAMLTGLAADIAFGISALRTRLAHDAAQTQAHASELRFRAAFDQAAVGIVYTSLDGRFLQVNRKFCDMLGYCEAELIGRSATDIHHPDDRDKGSQYRSLMWRGEVQNFTEEKRYLRKDGSVLWTRRTVSLARDADGEPMYFIRVIEDITDQVLAAQRRDMEHAVAAVLTESPSLESAMPQLLRIVCEGQGWACGLYWWWDCPAELLRCAEVWHVGGREVEQFVEASIAGTNEAPAWVGKAPGTMTGGLVRSVWTTGAPVWISDAATRPGFRRGTFAAQADLHCAFGFPILAGERPLGVMEFYSRDIKEPDEELLRVVQALGRQIGQFIQRKEAERALRLSEERYRDMFESSPLPMWVRDDATRTLLTVNQAAVDHYGYSREEFLGMRISDLWDPTEREAYEQEHFDRTDAEINVSKRRHVTKDGRTIDVEVTSRAFDLDGRRMRLTLLNDVTERLRAEEKLRQLAHFDTLTGLPNRVLFYDRLRHALAQAKRNGWITGVMFMDVDRFKNINDTLGHDVGDQLLRQVSQRLSGSVRAADTVGRLGGDEFAIVLSNLTSADDASVVAEKIMAHFNQPFRLDGSEIFVTTSIGITLYPKDGLEQDVLLKNADAAMYRAKEAGRNTYQYYTPEMSARASTLLMLEGALRKALERDEFLLHFQPKASVATGNITGVEALLRWRHPERGLVSPAEFIPVLEETGLIVQASEWVLNAVCAQLAAWKGAGVRQVPVAVNLSARQFLARDLGATIKRILEHHGVSPSLIELEITESSLMVNPVEATRTLEYLKSLGVSLSIDDFGTGYSSLGYLKRFPLDALKIDRSFVRDITTDSNDATITLAVISMAHSLGLKVIAEGVENAEQLAFLAKHGCDQIQGYYLARPLPADECTRALVERRRLNIAPAGQA